MGYLGGPNFPDDPTDLGPLVPLPGGFIEVFEYLASVGFRGFEFFQFTQNVNELGGSPRTRRSARTSTTRGSVVRHPHGRARRDVQRDHAQRADRDRPHPRAHDDRHRRRPRRRRRPRTARQLGGRGQQLQPRRPGPAAEGLRYYRHAEQNNFHFFNDPANPSLSWVHRIDWFTEHTTRRRVLRAGHPALLRGPRPLPLSRRRVALGRLDCWKTNGHRILGWHIKDGTRLVPPPARGGTRSRRRSCAHRGSRTRSSRARARSGRATRSTPTRPWWATSALRRGRPEGRQYAIIESDSGPGPATTPAARCATPSTACRTCWGCAAA